MSAINLTSVLNSAGASGTVNIDSANKKTEAKTTSLGFLEDANLTVTEGAAGIANLREIIKPRLAAMMNGVSSDAAGLMAVMKTLADTNTAIIKNMKPTDEQKRKLEEEIKKLREMMQRLQDAKEDYAQTLIDFKNLFVNTQDMKLFETRVAEENPIKA